MTAIVRWPGDDAEAWNRCELDGLEVPGLAIVKVKLSDELDIKKPKGLHGATITRQGRNPAKVSILVRMWEPEQFAAFQAIVVPLRPKVGRGNESSPVHIIHPKTMLWGIDKVIIQEIDDSNGERGDLYDVTFDCIEHFPPPKNVPATKTDTKLKTYENSVRSTAPPVAKPSATSSGP